MRFATAGDRTRRLGNRDLIQRDNASAVFERDWFLKGNMPNIKLHSSICLDSKTWVVYPNYIIETHIHFWDRPYYCSTVFL